LVVVLALANSGTFLYSGTGKSDHDPFLIRASLLTDLASSVRDHEMSKDVQASSQIEPRGETQSRELTPSKQKNEVKKAPHPPKSVQPSSQSNSNMAALSSERIESNETEETDETPNPLGFEVVKTAQQQRTSRRFGWRGGTSSGSRDRDVQKAFRDSISASNLSILLSNLNQGSPHITESDEIMCQLSPAGVTCSEVGFSERGLIDSLGRSIHQENPDFKPVSVIRDSNGVWTSRSTP
jgi:hypothetical protein